VSDSPRNMTPLYYQVREKIRDDIEAGQYLPGALVSSELDLCEAFGVSRITVRRAMADLVAEGLLTRERGRGTFVTKPRIERNFASDVSFARDMIRSGYSPTWRDVSISEEPASPRVAALVSVPTGAVVLRVIRTHLADGEPIMRQETLIPRSICPKVDSLSFTRSPVFVVLEETCGVRFTRVRTSIVPTLIGAEDAAFLNAVPGSPALLAEQQVFTSTGECVLNRSTVRGDRCKFVAETSFREK
jgi:GntR family transcriptional regulator